MDLKERHIYESNKLGFKLACIIQVFELAATILYRDQRVGFSFVNTTTMSIIQIIMFICSIYAYLRYSHRTRGRYLMLGSMLIGYAVLMAGCVHVTYMWAFGPSFIILSLLFNDVKLTIATSIITAVINLLYTPLFYMFSVEVADRHFAVMTDTIFMVLLSLMGIFYVRLNSNQNKETMDEIEENIRLQEESSELIKDTGITIAKKLEDANEAMESLASKVSSSAEAAQQISESVNLTAEAIQTQTEMNSNITDSLEEIAHQARAMRRNSDEVSENISDGNALIEELRAKSDEASAINAETATMTSELQESAVTLRGYRIRCCMSLRIIANDRNKLYPTRVKRTQRLVYGFGRMRCILGYRTQQIGIDTVILQHLHSLTDTFKGTLITGIHPVQIVDIPVSVNTDTDIKLLSLQE